MISKKVSDYLPLSNIKIFIIFISKVENKCDKIIHNMAHRVNKLFNDFVWVCML